MLNDPEITLEVGIKAIIQNSFGQFLFLKRARPYPEQKICKWDVPGGRIKPGEPIFKALKREIFEETGLTLNAVLKILSVQDILRVANRHTVRVTVVASCNDGEVVLDPQEHQAYGWFNHDEIKKLRLDLYLAPVLKDLIR